MTEQARPTAAILTLGCRVNQYESQAIAQALEAKGIDLLPHTAVCDFYIVNTCAVTSESGRKSRQMIHSLHKQNPGAKILVTGCEAQRDAATLLQSDGVDSVYSNRNKMAIVLRILALLDGASDAVPLFDTKASLCAPTNRCELPPPSAHALTSKSKTAATENAPTASFPPCAAPFAHALWKIQ